MATDAESWTLLRTQGAVPRLVWLLSGNHPGLLSAAVLTIANLTEEDEALELLENMDAARLLWSLLKHPAPSVQAGAASAIAAFSQRSKVYYYIKDATSFSFRPKYYHVHLEFWRSGKESGWWIGIARQFTKSATIGGSYSSCLRISSYGVRGRNFGSVIRSSCRQAFSFTGQIG